MNNMKSFLIQASCTFACLLMLAGCGHGPDRDMEKRIFVNYTSLRMWVDDEIQITASPTGETFRWVSTDDEVVTVSQQGEVRAVGRGICGIIVSCEDFLQREITVVVAEEIPVTEIEVSKLSLELLEGGETATLTTSLLPKNFNEKEEIVLLWQSSDPTVATVSDNGVVTPVGEGPAVITVSLQHKPSVNANIPVTVRVERMTMDVATFTVSDELLFSKVSFIKGIVVTIEGIDQSLIESAYNRDFFNYDWQKDRLVFVGETGEWEVYYSSKYNYFWILRMSDIAPDAHWIIGARFCSAFTFHEDFKDFSNWTGANIVSMGYLRPLGNGKYQTSGWFGFIYGQYIIRKERAGDVNNLLNLTVTGAPGFELHPTVFSHIHTTGDVVAGYYRVTLDTENHSIDFEPF